MKSNKSNLAENTLALQIKQLIYTSFAGRGFVLLTSKTVPLLVQKIFTKRFVQTCWDPYLPPSTDYRAAYLCQMPAEAEGTLFGWLYHDGFDEIGRSDIPYFIAYYLSGKLPASQLSAILTILEQGPVSWVDRHDPFVNLSLETLTIRNVRQNSSVREGVSVPTAIRVQSYEAMQSQELIDFFFAHTSDQGPLSDVHSQRTLFEAPVDSSDSDLQTTALARRSQDYGEPHSDKLTMKTDHFQGILQELVFKPIGISGAVLVSSEGQAVSKPIGLDEGSSGIIAGTMIYLAKNTKAALNWSDIELVSMKAPEGYIILSRCDKDTYLLVQSGKVPLGLLEGEISQTVTKIREKLLSLSEPEPLFGPLPEPSPELPPNYLALEGIAEDSLNSENEVTYRGRRVV